MKLISAVILCVITSLASGKTSFLLLSWLWRRRRFPLRFSASLIDWFVNSFMNSSLHSYHQIEVWTLVLYTRKLSWKSLLSECWRYTASTLDLYLLRYCLILRSLDHDLIREDYSCRPLGLNWLMSMIYENGQFCMDRTLLPLLQWVIAM